MANENEDDGRQQSAGEALTSQGASVMPLFNSTEDFRVVSRRLKTPVDIEKKAEGVLETLLTELDQRDDIEMSQREIIVCALYMALIDARMPYGPDDPQLKHGYLAVPPVTLTNLLMDTHISVKQLLQKMRQVKEMLVLSEAVTEHLNCLEKNFCVMCALSHTFDRLCGGVFREEEKSLPRQDFNEEQTVPCVTETEGVGYRRNLCWLLFLIAKRRLVERSESLDLIHGFMALLCCLECVLRTTPSFLLNSPYDLIRIGCQQTTDCTQNSLLARLCEQFEADFKETEGMAQGFMEPIFKDLLNADGELDADQLSEMYTKLYTAEGDLNETFFLSKDPLFFPSNHNGHDCKNQEAALSLQNCDPHMTPIRATLQSIQLLKNSLASAADGPSSKLQDYFQICTSDPGPAIASRISRMKELFVAKFVEVGSPYQAVAEPRFTLGVKLYYRMLELLLNNDSKRLSVSVLDTLLNKEDFHTSLLASCLEVVLLVYGLVGSRALNDADVDDSPFSFPWILETLRIQAYDFFKVLESFIRAEPRLPGDVIKHLQNIEYKILESIAWKEGSSLFEVIRVCDRGQATPPKNSPTDPLASGTNGQLCPSAAQLFLSPMPSRSAVPTTSPSLSPATSSARLLQVPRRSQSLTSFFNKLYRLAHHRLQRLCSLLQISRDMLHKVWTCFENCITYKPELLRNRHLDQILMCSVYGVCKVMERERRFRTIVQEYRNMPHADPEVFRSVNMGDGRLDSIISFYNSIFIVSMKSCLQQLAGTSRQGTATLSPVPHPVPPQPASPAFSVAGRKNFIISPLKESPFKSSLKESPFKAPRSPSQLTPVTRQLYCFADGPRSSEKLRSINASVSAVHKRRMKLSASALPKEKVRRLLQFDRAPSNDNQTEPDSSVTVGRRVASKPPEQVSADSSQNAVRTVVRTLSPEEGVSSSTVGE